MAEDTKFDPFTAAVALAAVKKNPKASEDVIDLLKSITGTPSGGPSKEAVDFFNANKGKLVKVKWTSYIGEVYALNTCTSGFYPGSRYPIYVKIVKSRTGDWVGNIFEYDLDHIELEE